MCLSQARGLFPALYVVVFALFSELRWEVIVRLIVGIVDHHCLNFLVITNYSSCYLLITNEISLKSARNVAFCKQSGSKYICCGLCCDSTETRTYDLPHSMLPIHHRCVPTHDVMYKKSRRRPRKFITCVWSIVYNCFTIWLKYTKNKQCGCSKLRSEKNIRFVEDNSKSVKKMTLLNGPMVLDKIDF